jgi:membrane glycosyltransferase
MPPRAPLAMPLQDLSARPGVVRPRRASERARERTLLLAAAAAFAALYAVVLGRVLGADGRITAWEGVTVVLSALLNAWLAFGFVSASAGFITGLTRRPPRIVRARRPKGRTAILLPAYNEDPALVLAGVEAMATEARRVGLPCDLFILSDTRDRDVARAEALGVARLRARWRGGPQIYYRRRRENIDRKAGNVGEWVANYGGAYDYMLVLDADSLMSGEAMAELAVRMDCEPGLGLLQTAPAIINAATLFARLQQFANRLYGPVFSRGLHWWSGSEGNYWGHNAIIRVKAFAACARLPHLTGPRPFGGDIRSHDFVEAALLRRAGWAVRLAPGLAGSYEESPPTLLDSAVRDRRWCQGNLQHGRVLSAAGLHWVSRLHLVCGILAYLAPVMWLALLGVGGFVWPTQDIARGSPAFRAMVGLFALSLTLLAAPKVMALALALRDPELRRGFGGAPMLLLGVLLETVASILTTPVMMVMQSVAVFDVLFGRDAGWAAQRREGVELRRRDAWRAHGGHVLLGVLGAVGAFRLGADFLFWTSPVFLSLSLSAFLSLHGSRRLPGRDGDKAQLFQTPEETDTPRVVRRAAVLRAAYAAPAAPLPYDAPAALPDAGPLPMVA